MEEAFIKVRLLVKDKSDLDRSVKEISEKLNGSGRIIGSNIGKALNDKGKTIGETIGNNFGKIIAGGIFAKLSQTLVNDFEKAMDAQQKTQNLAEQINTLQKMTGGSISDVITTQQLLDKSNTKNPIGFFNNFVSKLNEAKSGDSSLLKDYVVMNNSQAFNLFMQDLQRANIKTRNEVVNDIWGGIYGDNAQMILSNNVKSINTKTKNRIDKLGGEKVIKKAIDRSIDFSTSEKDKDFDLELQNLLSLNDEKKLDVISRSNDKQRGIIQRAIEDMGKTATAKDFSDNIGIVITETAKSFADIMTTGAKNFVDWITSPSPYESNNTSRYSNGDRK